MVYGSVYGAMQELKENGAVSRQSMAGMGSGEGRVGMTDLLGLPRIYEMETEYGR